MTRPRRRPASRVKACRTAVAVLLAGCFLVGSAGTPVAAARNSRPIAAPAPAATAPAFPTKAVTGMCQCIADHDKRHISCLPSPQECQSACGATGQYSFVPRAPSCPVTSQ